MGAFAISRQELRQAPSMISRAMGFIGDVPGIFPFAVRVSSLAGEVMENVINEPRACSAVVTMMESNLAAPAPRNGLPAGLYVLGALAVTHGEILAVRYQITWRPAIAKPDTEPVVQRAAWVWPDLSHRFSWEMLGQTKFGTHRAFSADPALFEAADGWVMADESPAIHALRAEDQIGTLLGEGNRPTRTRPGGL